MTVTDERPEETDDAEDQPIHGGSDDILGFGVLPERREGLLRGPILAVSAVVATVVLGAFLYLSDQNSDRWELRCGRDSVEPRRGLYFPWWTRGISGDSHDVLELPEGVSCATVSLASRQELDTTLANLLLDSAEHRLQQGGPEALAHARQDVERARRLSGLPVEQQQRAADLLADMAYHDAREILRQVERSLWQARRKLERARSLGAGHRIGDLGEWLDFVEAETERFRPGLGNTAEDEPPETIPPDAGAEPEPERPVPPEEIFL